jgi:hypothetical protein
VGTAHARKRLRVMVVNGDTAPANFSVSSQLLIANFRPREPDRIVVIEPDSSLS